MESVKILCYKILPVLTGNNDVQMRALGHDVLCLLSIGGFSSEAECHCSRVNGVWSTASMCKACRGDDWFGGDQFHRLQRLMCKALLPLKTGKNVQNHVGFKGGWMERYKRDFRQELPTLPLDFRYDMAKGEMGF